MCQESRPEGQRQAGGRLHLLLKVWPYVKPQVLKLCQREGILASGKHRRSLARSKPICGGLDLLPDWDTPYIRDEFNCWCGVCTASDALELVIPSRRMASRVFNRRILCAKLTLVTWAGVPRRLHLLPQVLHDFSFEKIIFLAVLGSVPSSKLKAQNSKLKTKNKNYKLQAKN